jgi:hypothetical protein
MALRKFAVSIQERLLSTRLHAIRRKVAHTYGIAI